MSISRVTAPPLPDASRVGLREMYRISPTSVVNAFINGVTLGAAMVFGPEAIDGFAESALADSRVLDFADRVEALLDEDLEAAFPRHFGSWVEIERADGEKRRADVLDSLGTPARPMTEAALIRKYAMLCDALPGLPTGQALWDRVETFACGGGAEELLDGFGLGEG